MLSKILTTLREIKASLREEYYRKVMVGYFAKKHQRLLADIKRKGHANVVFVVSNLPMWRGYGLYQLLKHDDRFDVTIVLCPFLTYSESQKKGNMQMLRYFLDEKGISYIDVSLPENQNFVLSSLTPDILFYTQPYLHVLQKGIDSSKYLDKLLCYAPYSFITLSNKWNYNNLYQVLAWKLFYETEFHKGEGIRLCDNKGVNIIVTGDAHADSFLSGVYKDVWKKQEKKKARIIWAPHFTVIHNEWLNRGAFVWAGEYMLELARSMSDKIQIAFKPHPRLRTELYRHPDWGVEKTDAYYKIWDELDNGQFEDGEFIDLFMTSDAIIHDSGSFTAEYHYSHKPAMFLTKDKAGSLVALNDIGKRALNLHYFGGTINDIDNFVTNVVLAGNDPKRSEREQFFDECLLPPDTGNVAQNTYNDIVKSLGFDYDGK